MAVKLIALFMLLVIVVTWLLMWWAERSNPSKCTGHCNQGRNCDCYDK